MTTLYRPVGLHELALIWDSGMLEFPPRLPQQPIFYPVANIEYATQIARDWNTKDPSFVGYVTKFAVADSFLANFEPRTVGSATHVLGAGFPFLCGSCSGSSARTISCSFQLLNYSAGVPSRTLPGSWSLVEPKMVTGEWGQVS